LEIYGASTQRIFLVLDKIEPIPGLTTRWKMLNIPWNDIVYFDFALDPIRYTLVSRMTLDTSLDPATVNHRER
jgi:hypothetical protein